MTTTPEDLLTELFRQIGALGREIDDSADPQAAAARTAQSLARLRAAIDDLDAGEDGRAALAQTAAAIERMRAELASDGADPAALDGLSAALGSGDGADAGRAIDAQTGGAFSRYRADNEARALNEIGAAARANADRSARQVKPDLDLGAVMKRAGPRADGAREDEP